MTLEQALRLNNRFMAAFVANLAMAAGFAWMSRR
jgi:hypothetical protein